MSNTFRYDKTYESELIALLKKEPEWNSFTRTGAIDVFKSALLSSQTYICKSQSEVCGYIRALVDGFGIYVSELYVAPAFRNNGYGKELLKELLKELKQDHPDQVVYVLSDEDLYYEKIGCKRVGSVFQL
ncbi:GNAT family N-acetyltransferase [Pelagibius litoralis]|uniref:GNAT family N-acetyltransferase n=1 Tax=Pelagibius litoralis TaxID=374515 RepID=A0A967F346_9PROT|nr:GNAT family N-acetyltransferase [Pelagibius litoralis]NIA72348.1 GNAT family N-acetyltransferase [Pelagibius litoralis]